MRASLGGGALGRLDHRVHVPHYVALACQRSSKGVFLTTSGFTSQTIEFARSVERVVLVDGARLADLMIDHELGVTLRPVRVPRLGGDYFEEESA
jgi:restriction system protein